MKTKVLLAAVGVFVLGIVVSLAWADDEKAAEGRYRLHNGTNRAENLVFRIDTRTGETWVLSAGKTSWETIK